MKSMILIMLVLFSSCAFASGIEIGSWHVFKANVTSAQCKNPDFVKQANIILRENRPDPYNMFKQNGCIPFFPGFGNTMKFKIVRKLNFGNEVIVETDQPLAVPATGAIQEFVMYMSQEDVDPKNLAAPTAKEIQAQ